MYLVSVLFISVRSIIYEMRGVRVLLITVGSVTTAARLARILEKNTGYPAEVVHTPAAINRGGCSYSVRYPEKNAEAARALIRQNRIPARKYYSEQVVDGKREYHDIS